MYDIEIRVDNETEKIIQKQFCVYMGIFHMRKMAFQVSGEG